jgi:hypothetical protein
MHSLTGSCADALALGVAAALGKVGVCRDRITSKSPELCWLLALLFSAGVSIVMC